VDKKSLGARVRELREAKGLTQQQLADAAGLSKRVVEESEQGRNWLTWPVACALVDALGVSLDELRKEPEGEVAPPKRGRPRKGQDDEGEPTASG
jgi:transcriptional regulator with XRE-family HTH domain